MKFKLYGIIVLICFVLGSLLFFNKEGFESDYSDYNKIDRVMDSSGKYGYCIAGKVTCPPNLVRKELNDDYTINGKGTTYELLCYDNDVATKIPVECSGNYIHKLTHNDKMPGQEINDYELNWKTPTARQIKFQFSDMLKGFSNPYTYIPVKMNKNNIEFYNSNNIMLDSLHKCEMLNNQEETNNCYFELAKADAAKIAADAALIEQTAQEAADAVTNATNTEEPQKCIADFGTDPGDPLCCGQTGVLQYSAYNYVCPETAKTCSNYVCGEKYGTCGP